MSIYSIDLRERVLAALDRGMPRSEVVLTFRISLSSLKRGHRARRDTGDFAPKPPSGGPTLTITPAQDEQLRAHVAASPDAIIAEHTEQTHAHDAARGLGITRNGVGDRTQVDRVALDQPDNDPDPHGQSLQMERWMEGTELRLDLGV